jgi:LacI family transcriptional regulator
VSPATVSNVLNRPDRVSGEARRRVLEAAEALGWSPDPRARALRAGASAVVGVVVTDVGNPFWGRVVAGLEEGLAGSGLVLHVASSHQRPKDEDAILASMAAHRPVAMVVAATLPEPRLEQRCPSGTRLVLVDRPAERTSFTTVDHVAGGRLLTDHLLAVGHRRIAVAYGPARVWWCRARMRGAESACRAADLNPAEVLVRVPLGELSTVGGAGALRWLVDAGHLRGGRGVTALAAGNDLVALGVLGAARHAGLRVPADLAVTGYDDDEFAALLSPSLTTVRQPPEQLGGDAARAVLGDAVAAVHAPQLVVRGSSAPHGA